jgi:uncharacterized protein (DUF39 family)
VLAAAGFRQLVGEQGLAEAYRATDVVVAANAEFTDQGTLLLQLGPTDPPIRLRDPQLDGLAAFSGGIGSDLALAIGTAASDGNRRGGAHLLVDLLAGERLEFSAGGEATPLQPRRDLHTWLSLDRIGYGRLLLHRAIVENGVVAVSSAEGLVRSAYGPLLGPFANALYSCGGADSIGLAMPGLTLLGPGSPVLVAGAIGWVTGSGSGHQPDPRRLPSGHARTPGAVAAVSVDLHEIEPGWLRACHFEGHGSALLVPIAAPIPLLNAGVAQQLGPDALLDLGHDFALQAPGALKAHTARAVTAERGGPLVLQAYYRPPDTDPTAAAVDLLYMCFTLRQGWEGQRTLCTRVRAGFTDSCC